MDSNSSLSNTWCRIVLICIALILFSLVSIPTSAETCFFNSPHKCKDYVDRDGNGVCDLDADNKNYPKMTSTPTPTQTPKVQVDESQASDEITIDEGANQLYDPKTKTVFFLNDFGYVTTQTHYSEEELRKRWNEIMKELGRNTAQEEQKEDNAPVTSITPDEDIPESTIQDTESGDDLGNLLLEDENGEEPVQTTTDEEDTSLETILSQTDETENEEDLNEDENPLSGSLTLDLAGALTGAVSEDISQDSPEEKTSSNVDNKAENGGDKEKEKPSLDEIASFLIKEWGIDASSEDIIVILKDDPELAANILDQYYRHVDIYETNHPKMNIDKIGAYDDVTFTDLFFEALKNIATSILRIPDNPLEFPEKVAQAIRDNVLGTRTLISKKGREFLEEAKKLELEGESYEDACKNAWNKIETHFTHDERYKLSLLQDLIPREKGGKITTYLENSYTELYKQLRRHDEDLISYEQKENAKIRATLQNKLNEKIRKLKEEREK